VLWSLRLLGSDSQVTEGAGNVRYPGQKIFELGSRGVLGGSGSYQVIKEIRDDLAGLGAMLDASPDLAQTLVGQIRPILQKHYEAHLDAPNMPPTSPATSILACGMDQQGEPWIIEIDHTCQRTRYEDRGLHAIGSGAAFGQLANLLMGHFQANDRPLAHGKLIAYRVMRSVIEISAYGVGEPVEMWVVDKDGPRRLEKRELDEIRGSVGAWEVERETLDSLMGPSTDVGPACLPSCRGPSSCRCPPPQSSVAARRRLPGT
jgi:20S proteasome alpha/beta subunit